MNDNKKNLKILQLNWNKSKIHENILIEFMNTNSPLSIAILQEPYTYNNKITGFYDSNYTLDTFCPIISQNLTPKVCIIAKKSLKLLHVPAFDDQDMIVCRLDLNSQPIWIVNIYMNKNSGKNNDGNERSVTAHLELLNKFLQVRKQNEGTIICTDSNCRSSAWGDRVENKQGSELREWLDSSDLMILNTKNHGSTYRIRLCVRICLTKNDQLVQFLSLSFGGVRSVDSFAIVTELSS